MCKLITLFIVLILSQGCTSENNDLRKANMFNITSNSNFTNDSIIEAKVILISNLDEVKNLPYCGCIENEVILKYEIVKLISGTYSGKTIRIFHSCPRELVEKKIIEKDKVYTFKLKHHFEDYHFGSNQDYVVNDTFKGFSIYQKRLSGVNEKFKPVDTGVFEIVYVLF